jgi:flagellar basal-body rod modification protein FlgD
MMSPISAADIESYNAKSSKKTNSMDPQESQDRFLKLLVTQLQNQDPMNPMDNAQTTTQMAQINTVSGIQELNKTLQSMADQYTSMQSMQGTLLVGRQVLTDGNQVAMNGDQAQGSFSLPSSASEVTVEVLGASGAVLGSVPMGTQAAGTHSFNWNASGIDPKQITGFQVKAANGTQSVAATTYSTVKVQSVSMVDGAMRLQTSDGKAMNYGDVRAFL